MKSKVWLLSVCVLASIPLVSWSSNEAKDSVVVLNDSISLEGYNPKCHAFDSTALFILDGKLIPYNEGLKLITEVKTIESGKIFLSKEAIFLYGEKARDGAVVSRTIKTEEP